MAHKIFEMSFNTVYSALEAKVIRKGYDKGDVGRLVNRLMGYSIDEIDEWKCSSRTYGQFFQQAPAYHPNRKNITGKICGVAIEEVSDSMMQEIRRLDKLVDLLAKGKTVEEIHSKYQLDMPY